MASDGDRTDGYRCVACGCTNDRACPGGCYWVGANRCSACFDDDGMPFAVGDDAEEAFGVELCPASETPAPHVRLFDSATTCYCARCQAQARRMKCESDILQQAIDFSRTRSSVITQHLIKARSASNSLATRQRHLDAAIDQAIVDELVTRQTALGWRNGDAA